MHRSNTTICKLELAINKKMVVFIVYLYQHWCHRVCNCYDEYTAENMQSTVSIFFTHKLPLSTFSLYMPHSIFDQMTVFLSSNNIHSRLGLLVHIFASVYMNYLGNQCKVLVFCSINPIYFTCKNCCTGI